MRDVRGVGDVKGTGGVRSVRGARVGARGAVRRRVAGPVAALALLCAATGCQGESSSAEARFDDPAEPVEVAAGESFVLELRENPSVGHEWTLIDPEPDDSVVRADGDDYEADEPDQTGSGGTRLLRFEAVEPGATTITLTRLFRGEHEPETDVAFDVEVADAG
ncbi:inhibitor of cysteine peptidase [Streptomyces zhaozhouensis]|uniref:Inhibitor of cysteine peptidase n=1 Tax=Streptomyces zhaozhouensis TaxID=1300267 RepID=A0A286E2T4_9ACTN|nr:protease inhibitor I42 family protein [Streptomyces zhaozhouensis]SOD65202.1 inhibitor of cysteine peptidase [Streptomyces zhaozhouensis]